jgi:hypothetical protein
VEHIYEDIKIIVGQTDKKKGRWGRQPHLYNAIQQYLREKITDARFWDGEYDPSHIGDIDVPTMDEESKKAMWERYAEEQERMRKILRKRNAGD